MLASKKPDREINQWHVESTENGKNRRDHRGLTTGRKPPQHQIADVNQPKHQRGGEPDIPGGPPDAPNRPRPDGAGNDHYGAEHDADFSRDKREDVGFRIAANQIGDRGYEIDQEQEERRPCRRNVIIKDALHVAHGAFGGRTDQSLIERKAEQRGGDNREDGESAFHSASRMKRGFSILAIVTASLLSFALY